MYVSNYTQSGGWKKDEMEMEIRGAGKELDSVRNSHQAGLLALFLPSCYIPQRYDLYTIFSI